MAAVQDLDMRLSAILNTNGLDKMMGSTVGRDVRRELSRAVGDNLAIIEERHKTHEVNRASRSSMRAVPDRWTTRTGQLRRSFHRVWKPGQLEGSYGSNLPRAEKVEEGGTIRPKGKYLAIPTENAPKGIWPRYMTGLVFIQSLKGQPLLVKPHENGPGFDVMFILRRSVTLPPRQALRRATKFTESKRDRRLFAAVEKGAFGAK